MAAARENGKKGGRPRKATEIATALGFPSVEAMNRHQIWLEEQKNMDIEIMERIKISGNIIDARDFTKVKSHEKQK